MADYWAYLAASILPRIIILNFRLSWSHTSLHLITSTSIIKAQPRIFLLLSFNLIQNNLWILHNNRLLVLRLIICSLRQHIQVLLLLLLKPIKERLLVSLTRRNWLRHHELILTSLFLNALRLLFTALLWGWLVIVRWSLLLVWGTFLVWLACDWITASFGRWVLSLRLMRFLA